MTNSTDLHDHEHSSVLRADLATQSEYGDSGTEDGALRLLSGRTWGGNGSGITLNYNFFDTLPGYYSSTDQEASVFREFNTRMKDATLRVLDDIESFTNIQFVESSNTTRQLGFGQARLPSGTGAWAYYPTSNPKGGDVWTNNLYSNTQNPVEGNYGYFLLLHEVGHALGLNHSFDRLSGQEASSQYSVMAYDWSPYFPASYMLYDIYALQSLYGANTSHATGDDVYVLNKNLAYTIWDAAGNDTLDASSYNFDVVLNLNDGSYSSVGLDNNIAIAFNAVIENAWGGSRNDKITGNDVNNILQGNAGNDTLIGSAGNDTLDGGDGIDTIVYDINIEDFLISVIDDVTIELVDQSGLYNTDTLINVEFYEFNLSLYNYDDLFAFSNGTYPDGSPLRPSGAIFSLTDIDGDHVAGADAIVAQNVIEKTIGLAFSTSSDVDTRQVLFEQGAGSRGMNIYIENGKLYHSAWNWGKGVSWGFKQTNVLIEANENYTTALVYGASSQSQGTMTLYLNGDEVSSISGTGYIYGTVGDLGLGQMRINSRFQDGSVVGDGYEFKGELSKVVYYNEALGGTNLYQLDAYLEHNWLVEPTNRAPELEDDLATVLVNGNILLDVLANDDDPDGDVLDIISISYASNGTVTLRADDSILYSPNENFEGYDSFTYTVRDEDGLESTASVNLTVTSDIEPDEPSGAIFSLTDIDGDHVAGADAIVAQNVIEKTIGLAFSTSSDVDTRQVLFEQGAGSRGMNIYIENGKLYHSAWNWGKGVSWGFKQTNVLIEANENYTTALVYGASSQSQGTMTLYLNGDEVSSISGTGYIYGTVGDLGLGQMRINSRFQDGSVVGDGYEFKGELSKVVYYNETLGDAELTQLNDYLGYNISALSHDESDLHGLPAFEEVIDMDIMLEEALLNISSVEQATPIGESEGFDAGHTTTLTNDEFVNNQPQVEII